MESVADRVNPRPSTGGVGVYFYKRPLAAMYPAALHVGAVWQFLDSRFAVLQVQGEGSDGSKQQVDLIEDLSWDAALELSSSK